MEILFRCNGKKPACKDSRTCGINYALKHGKFDEDTEGMCYRTHQEAFAADPTLESFDELKERFELSDYYDDVIVEVIELADILHN